ncbi:hypothetical protein SAMD00019534_054250, partial [Acytostelium subglobosum LB1]|uniref:hypothetical protein n=1 Tax=Acytostelium subglobosum LB1 TaxID=1410327 RepID=UPI0006448834
NDNNNNNSKQRMVIGVGQLTSTNSKDENYNVCRRLVEKAAEQGVNMFCLPENFAFMSGGVNQFESRENAEPLDGPTMTRYAQLAKQHKMWLSLGGFHQRIESDPDFIHNTHVIINDQGDIVTTYNKIHLYDVNIPSKGITFNESKVVRPGDKLVLCDSPVGKLGLTVCYDVRFPELYISLRKMGAQVLLVPAAFMKKTGEAHWKTLLQARAIENQCYVVAAAQTGQHHSKRESYGHSLIIDPWGTILSEIESGEGIATASIDLDHLDNVRENIPVSKHRKPELYSI